MDILLIDDEAPLRKTLRLALQSMNHRVFEASSGTQARDLCAGQKFDVVFLDVRLAREAGLDLLPMLLRHDHPPDVVVMTAYASIDSAVEAMRRGAFDYLPKPFTPDQLRVVLDRSALVRGLREKVADLEDQVRNAVPDSELDSAEPAMRQALDVAFRVAASEATILLRGESGTGKGVLARAIHGRSPRAAGPFITVHCPSLSAELLESELFGHARGAFTGAVKETTGKVAAAEGGTLFLDEIGDLPPALQPKLLHLLQEKTFERVGETHTQQADVRLIAATNRVLEAEVAAGRFREDLFYRLNVIEIVLPPLRQRPGDILPLAERLLRFFARQTGKLVAGFTAEAQAALARHAWPGNVRELRNAVERGVILTADAEVGSAHLPARVGAPTATKNVEVGGAATLEELEAEHIRRVLATSPSLEDAAQILGIDPSTLYRKRKRYGL